MKKKWRQIKKRDFKFYWMPLHLIFFIPKNVKMLTNNLSWSYCFPNNIYIIPLRWIINTLKKYWIFNLREIINNGDILNNSNVFIDILLHFLAMRKNWKLWPLSTWFQQGPEYWVNILTRNIYKWEFRLISM